MSEIETKPTAADQLQAIVKPQWLDLLRHTLGAGRERRKSQHGYRNRFCAGVGSPDYAEFRAMEAAGFAQAGPAINDGTSRYFRATVAGCELIGLSKAATKRAFED